ADDLAADLLSDRRRLRSRARIVRSRLFPRRRRQLGMAERGRVWQRRRLGVRSFWREVLVCLLQHIGCRKRLAHLARLGVCAAARFGKDRYWRRWRWRRFTLAARRPRGGGFNARE